MQPLQETFDELYRFRGGRLKDFETETLYDVQKLGALKLIADLKLSFPKVPSIYVDFIDNSTLNASATKYKNQFFIGINSGTSLLNLDLFYKLLALPNILLDIGDVSLEKKHNKRLNFIYTDRGVEFKPYSDEELIAPNCKIRDSYVHLYSTWAFLFLVLHECGHIIRGHVGYMGRGQSRFSLDEYPYTITEKEYKDNFLSQIMEFDADAFAINHLLRLADYAINHNEQLRNISPALYANWEHFTEVTIFSVYGLFKMLGLTVFDPNKVPYLSHPPTSIRVSKIIDFFNGYIPDRSIEKSILKALNDAETGFLQIGGTTKAHEVLASAYSDKGNNYAKDLTNGWNDNYNLFQPYAYMQLLPVKTIPW